jgi:hypothetical protein
MSRLLRAGAVGGPASNVERSVKAERPLRAERFASTARAPGAEPSAGAGPRGFNFQDLPSGLASLVFHFAVLIVLGLLYTEHAKPHLTEVIVDWQQGTDELAGGGGGTDGIEAVAEAAAPDEDWTKTADEMAEAVPNAEALLADAPVTSEFGEVTADIAPADGSSDVLATLAGMGEVGLRGIGTGGGSGGGEGKGNGPGMGDGVGPGSKTGIFGVSDEGSRIIYVFDRSESMNSRFTLNSSDGTSKSITTLEAAKSELTKSVNELSDGAEFQMIFYNDEPLPFPDHYQVNGLSKADAKTKEFAQQFIYQLPAQRNTNHIAALEMALKLKPDVIFLLTDGEEKDDPTSGEVRRLQGLARRSSTRINVINFCNEERPNSTLVSLAKRTKGQFKAILIRSLIDPKW